MNQHIGLLGTKLGNTQYFDEDGTIRRVTAVALGPCTVVGKRTTERDGYTALQLGFGARPEGRVNKPEAGFFSKQGVAASRIVREFRLTEEAAANYQVGQQLRPAEIFREGQYVDVTGTSKGRGFAGVIKRHGFKGAGSVGHGTHEYKRHGGSIGMNMTPGRTLPGQKMAGQYGNKRVTVLNVRVAKVLNDENIVLLKGSVPGASRGFIEVRSAVKKDDRNQALSVPSESVKE
ncbi:MAG: 50S ribosomal protein L3 [Pseudomonadota bacterium]